MSWHPFHRPLPHVKVRMPSGEVVNGRATEWNPDQRAVVIVRMPVTRDELRFGLVSGHISALGHGLPKGTSTPAIEPESLEALRERISRETVDLHPHSPRVLPQKSAHVLVAYSENSVAVEGGGKIVRLNVHPGLSAADAAAVLEAIIAFAEARARLSAEARVRGRVAGRASAKRRKTVRTKRRTP